jgi:hypothetical protein
VNLDIKNLHFHMVSCVMFLCLYVSKNIISYVLMALLRTASPLVRKCRDINACIAKIKSHSADWLDAEKLIQVCPIAAS